MLTHQNSVSNGLPRSFWFRTLLLLGVLAAWIAISPASLQAQNSPLTIQPSTGWVGIGTTSPTSKLHIFAGGLLIDGEATASIEVKGFSQASVSLYDTEAGLNVKEGRVISNDGLFRIQGVNDARTTAFDYLAVDLSNGNVGIGTTSPTTKLDVNGTLTATTKNFKIAHPLEPDKKLLIHSALEGPEAAVYYRGEAQLKDGETTITLPSYFEALTREEERTVQLTPINGWAPLYVVEEIKDGGFSVRTADGGNPTQRFYWELKAVRADVAPLIVEKEKDINLAENRR